MVCEGRNVLTHHTLPFIYLDDFFALFYSLYPGFKE